MSVLHVNIPNSEYGIVIERGVLSKTEKLLDLNRKILVVTDDNIPPVYAETVKKQCRDGIVKVIKSGEESKNLDTFRELLTVMLENNFTRKDAVIAVGGGVVGDLSGFAASCYMRGIDFYNIPTTLLSQVDSSVGGKTAVDLCGIKNIVGTFYQPKKVLIDPEVLKTLPKREFACGMAEVIKMAASLDKEFFEELEKADFEDEIETVIARAVQNKINVVVKDEKENGLRRVLNFGHTVGHGIESTTELHHGECVALGMLPMCGDAVRGRIKRLLDKAGLPTECKFDIQAAAAAASHDKKAENDIINTVTVDEIGSFQFEKINSSQLENIMKEVF